VTALAVRMPVGILTNGNAELQARKLRVLGLAQVPLFASSELPAPKPDVRAYEAACTGLGSAPFRTVMVGDDLPNDVEGALLAGLKAVWFTRGADRTAPVPVIADLRELLI
jgi:putative hydrolase of the HAD superfamily